MVSLVSKQNGSINYTFALILQASSSSSSFKYMMPIEFATIIDLRAKMLFRLGENLFN